MKLKLFFLLLLQVVFSFAQKPLSLADAEVELQKNNLLLLAEQYNISASQAAVIQAKIWEQPYITSELNAINPTENKLFDVGNSGQKVMAIQQLIYLGGKKKNEVAFAKSNVAIAELQLEQLLRNLKYQLAQTFYSVHFDKQKALVIESQIDILDTLLLKYEEQANIGNIPLKEVVRFQSLVLNLKNEKNTLESSIIEAQQTLSLLTGSAGFIEPIVNENELLNKNRKAPITKDSLLALALNNNLEYLTALKASQSQELFLNWQKSLSTPDITAGASYDQRGGAFQNQVNLTLGLPLPLWNKNKGNIKIAEAELMQSNITKEYKKIELQTKVEALWAIWLQKQKQYNSVSKSMSNNLESVYAGMLNNFQKRNVTMLEFTDFMESYNQATVQINEFKKAFILSGIDLNYIINKEIF